MALSDPQEKTNGLLFFNRNHMPFGQGPPWLLFGFIAVAGKFLL